MPELTEAYANSAKVKHKSIMPVLAGDPGNLLPINIDQNGKNCLDNIMERLYCIDGFGGELLPHLAVDLPVDNGDGTYDITIHDNIYDSDGNHLTAADVAFSYDYLLTNSTPQNMGKLKSVEAIDDYVVRFHCDTLDGVSDYGNLFGQQWIWCEAAMKNHNFENDPVGTGPYVVDEYIAGSELKLSINPNYWAEGQEYQLSRFCANVEEIDYKIVTDSSQQANGLRTGDLDYSNTIAYTDIGDFMNDGQYAADFGIYPYLENLTFYLLPNCDAASVCSDINLRNAILYAVDGATCAAASGQSNAEVVVDLFNSKFPEMRDSWYEQDNYYNNPSLETAKEYLDKSNYNGEEIVLLTQDAPAVCSDVATVVVNVLTALGLNVKLDVQSGSVLRETESNPENFDLLISMMAADDYGTVLIERIMGEASFAGGQQTINFIQDDKLQELVALCNTKEGHTDENTQELHDYIIDNAYGRGLIALSANLVTRNDVSKICVSYMTHIVPGGCIYTDNEF